MAKLLNMLNDHVVISDVQRMYTVQKMHDICTVIQNISSFEQHTKQFASTLKCHAFNAAHGGSVSNKSFAKITKTYYYVTSASSTMLPSCFIQYRKHKSFQYGNFGIVRQSLGDHTKNSVTLQ